jgi:hypothetical protein
MVEGRRETGLAKGRKRLYDADESPLTVGLASTTTVL